MIARFTERTTKAGFTGAGMRSDVALSLIKTHAVLWPARTLVVLALVTLVAIVEVTLTRAFRSA